MSIVRDEGLRYRGSRHSRRSWRAVRLKPQIDDDDPDVLSNHDGAVACKPDSPSTTHRPCRTRTFARSATTAASILPSHKAILGLQICRAKRLMRERRCSTTSEVIGRSTTIERYAELEVSIAVPEVDVHTAHRVLQRRPRQSKGLESHRETDERRHHCADGEYACYPPLSLSQLHR